MTYWDEKQYWADAATRNCVWLFQIKQRGWNEEHGCQCDVEYDEDGERTSKFPCKCFVDFWRTENVFLTRKEAEAWGESRPYEWGKQNEGWRVYGVPCCGKMAEILGRHAEEFEKEVEYITKNVEVKV